MIFEKKIGQIYKKQFDTRCDDKGLARYFSEKDFKGLKKSAFCFTNAEDLFLNGWFYFYGEMRTDRILVFDHGFGGGHRSYMREIETLCRGGYTVFSYDHTGCMTSSGNGTKGLGRSLSDLDACFTALKKDERFKNTRFSVLGHSWGGYAAMNIGALHPEIEHVVVFSGFVSVKTQIECFFGGIMKGYRGYILSLEREANGKYADFDGIETLLNYKGKALLVYSANDHLVSKSAHYDALLCALGDKENISFRLEERKGHNPNYTEEAVSKLSAYLKALEKFRKKKAPTAMEQTAFRASFDWTGMTEQDEDVWQAVFETLEM